MEKSQFLSPSARMMFLPALPAVNAGGIAKASVLNHRAGVRLSILFGSPTRFGNAVSRPGIEPMFSLSELSRGEIGKPLSKETIPAKDQFASAALAARLDVLTGSS